MIAFDLNKGIYTFKTDYRYFDLTESWEEIYYRVKEAYGKSKFMFEEIGDNYRIDKIKIGGEPEWWQEDETPIDP